MIRGVTVRVDDPHKVFVAGDVLSGRVFLDAGVPVTRLIVELICAEACHAKRTHQSEQIVYIHYRQTTEAFNATNNERDINDQNILRFKFLLSDKVDKCPPQSYVPVLSGVTWCVSVFVEHHNLSKGIGKQTVLACSSCVAIYPRVSSNIQSQLAVCFHGEQRFDKMAIALLDVPKFLPQGPNHFTLRMMLVPKEPVFVSLVEICLEKNITHEYLGAEERDCEETQLSSVEVFSVVDQNLAFAANNCHLTHREPEVFKSIHVEITYSLVVRVLSPYSVVARWPINVAPPSASRLCYTDLCQYTDEPPAYSESEISTRVKLHT